MRTPLHGLREPYTPPSNVIYFTDWRYVYSGGAAWGLPDGTRVSSWHTDAPHGGYEWNPLDMPRGVRIQCYPARRQPVDLPRDKSWEYTFGVNTLMRDGGRYRLWYTVCPPNAIHVRNPNHEDLLCYAESEDGFNWIKPELGLYEYEGTGGTNVVHQRLHGPAVFTDPHGYKMIYTGDVSDEQMARYKMRRPDDIDPYAHRPDIDEGTTFGVLGATSPDGLHWTALPDPLVVQHSDTQNSAYYDATLKKYVAYLRTWYLGRRCIGRSESDDFHDFTFPENILIAGATMDAPDAWYTNGRTCLPDAPDYHLMFPAQYLQATDKTAIILHTSADGILWSPVPGPAVLDSTDTGCIFASRDMVVLPDGRWAIPSSDYDVPHKYPRHRPIGSMAYAIWDAGRLASVTADDEGEFTLMQLAVDAKRIVLNVRGRVEVELDGRGWSDAIDGDHHSIAVTWQGNDGVDLTSTKPVKVRIRMRHAELFSIRFEGAAPAH